MSTEQRPDPTAPDLIVITSAWLGTAQSLAAVIRALPSGLPAAIVVPLNLPHARIAEMLPALRPQSDLALVAPDAETPLASGTIILASLPAGAAVRSGRLDVGGTTGSRPPATLDAFVIAATRAYGEHLTLVVPASSNGDDGTALLHVREAGGTILALMPGDSAPTPAPLIAPTVVDAEVDLPHLGPLLRDLLGGVRLPADEPADATLQRILEQLGSQTSVDFRSYRPSTIFRRIARRMAVSHSPTLGDYARYLIAHPPERAELVQAFLIRVTQFFRDPEVFAYLKDDLLPELLTRQRDAQRTLRIWSAGCATGEEPYSIAMLIADLLGDELPDWTVRIFATDVDTAAVTFARHGIYNRQAVDGVPPEYLERFFSPVDRGYQVGETVRRLVIFGEQDLGQAAPFPRIDLILCRNLLIYFTQERQEMIVGQFSFSLAPTRGCLVLGRAETLHPSSPAFTPRQKQAHVYQATGMVVPHHRPGPPRAVPAALVPGRAATAAPVPRADPAAGASDLPSLRRFNELLLRFLPVGVAIIDRNYRLLTANATARQMLGLRAGNGDQDFLHSVALRGIPYAEVRSALDSVFHNHAPVTLAEVQVNLPRRESTRYLALTFVPMRDDADGGDLAAVNITDISEQVAVRRNLEVAQAEQTQLVSELSAANRRLSDINKELMDANEELQVSNEELVLTQEELQATGEEYEATNEELQATNEELETNNEELQATNEELQTTNDELRARTNDLQELARQLETERARLAEMVELAPFDIMVLRGPRLLVDAFNSRYAQALDGRVVRGRPLEDVLDLFWQNGRRVLDLAEVAYKADAVRTTPRLESYLPGAGRQTEPAHYVYTLVPTHGANGQVEGVVLYAADVSEQWAREAEDERARLRMIFDHARQVALALYDAASARLITATPRYLELVGSGAPWLQLETPIPGADAATLWAQTLAAGTAVRVPEVTVPADRTPAATIWDWTLTPIADPAAPQTVAYMLVAAVEVTEQATARQQIEHIDRLKDEFLSLASHELRTPLTPLIGYADMLSRLLRQPASEDTDRTERITYYVDTIRDQLWRLSRLIEDLVDVSRLESGKFRLVMQPLDLRAVVDEAVAEGKMLSSKHEVAVHPPEPDTPLPVLGDNGRLIQVVMNLLQNAITYAPESDRIDVRLARVADPETGQEGAQVAVQDYGPGIPPEAQERLFSRFVQVARDDRPARGGLGLGLYICRQIVAEHGGEIAFESTLGEGSTFLVRLPLSDEAAAEDYAGVPGASPAADR